MNRIFRVIWSVRRRAFVVTSELASARGKSPSTRGSTASASKPGVFIVTAITAALSINTVFAAGVEVASGNTQVFEAPNGVQVVDIATANGAGVSHNRYIQYNIDATGQILNNNSALTQAGALQSQLGGQIVPNTNLTNEARVILNEVVSANRSSLNGYAEVVGGRADVVIANPYGITCSGCGFINSDRATLTTGVPTIGADGRLTGFKVNQGDLLIEGKGLDGRNQQVLDLVARSVKVDGQINAQDLNIVTGTNQYNYADRSTIAQGNDTNAPAYAIDSSVLGGMYANRIQLLATEGGVGVRMRGEAAASASDFTLSASGRIEINSQISAKRDLIVVTTAGTPADTSVITVTGDNAALTAERDLQLQANNAGITLDRSALTAGNNLGVTATSLLDNSAAGSRFAGNNTSINTTGNATINGSTWGAGNNLTANIGSLDVGTAGSKLYSGSDAQADGRSLTITATQGDIRLANAELQSPGALSVTSNLGSISVGTQGSVKAAADMTLAAASAIDNAGKLLGASTVTVSATDAQAAFINQGTIEAASNLVLGTAGHTLDVTNQVGSNVIADRIAMQANAIDNAGTIQAAQGMTVAAQSLRNRSGAQLTTSTVVGGDADLNITGSLGNQGTLQSSGDLRIAATGVVQNDGAMLTLRDTQGGDNGRLDITSTRLDNTGVVDAGGSMAVTVSDGMSNSGALQSDADMTLSTGNGLANLAGGSIVADRNLLLTSNNASFVFTNTGRLMSCSSLAVGSVGRSVLLNNQIGALLRAGDAMQITGSQLNNQGSVIAANGLTANVGTLINGASSNTSARLSGGALSVAGNQLTNHAVITANNAMTVNAGSFVNGTGANTAASITAGSLGLTSTQFNNQGVIGVQNGMTANVGTFINGDVGNSGALIRAAGLDNATSLLRASGTFSNHGGLFFSSALNIDAAGIHNANTGGIASLTSLTLTGAYGSRIDNYGQFFAGDALRLTSTGGTVRNWSSGSIDSYGTLHSASADFENNGAVVTVGNAIIDATGSFINRTLHNGQVITKEWGDIVAGDQISSVQIGEEGTFDSGQNVWMMDARFTREERFVGLTAAEVAALTKAQIIVNGAGNALSVNYRSGTGENTGGVMSANTVNITGSGTFTNQDLTLHRYTMVRRWIRVDDEKSGDDWFVSFARIDPSRDGAAYTGDPGDGNWDTWHPGAGWVKVAHTAGDGFPGWLADDALARAVDGAIMEGAVVTARSGSGIFATSFNFNGGTLVNAGSPWPDDRSLATVGNETSGNGGSAPTMSGVENNGETGGWSPDKITTQPGRTLLPGGLQISLPANPNGYYVIARDPNARYLVETNPNFAVGSNFVGSDYLAKRYGVNPDNVQKRLGDANYEAYLIRQQLIQQTGSNIIKGYDNEAAQMQKLMDQAYKQGQTLGLQFGKPLTPAQAASLTEDIVWMEEVEIDGQKVLSPRVYLAAATIAAINTGAVIGGDNVNIAGTGLQNTGGTIEGSDTLAIKTTGDVVNTSGNIRGGDVSVTSTEGSIRNETVAKGAGDDTTYVTAIGKTAGIESTGNMKLDAAKDITVLGGNVEAKGAATLKAGDAITFDTIVDKNTSSTSSSSSGLFSSTKTQTTVGTEKNIGSDLKTGGNLGLQSGGDTTIAGSNVDVGGDLDADTGGSFKVIARQDKVISDTQTSTSGLGVGGGLYGEQKTTVNDFQGTNAGSTLNVGGDASVKAGKEMVLQGSDANIAGNADIDAKEGIIILDGLDERRTTSKTETTTFLKLESDGGAQASAGAKAGGTEASASAEAGAEGSANLKLAETSTTTTRAGSNTSVASNLNVGGSLGLKTEGAVTVQGSNVAAGGDLAIDAKDVNVLTGRNEQWSESETNTVSVGIYNEAEAGAKAGAEAGVDQYGVASANAGASAEAGSTTTLGARVENSTESSYNLTNSASSLTSGGNMKITAKDTATFQGANVESGGDMAIEAENIRNVAAQDISTSSSSASTHTAGLYLGTNASAEASTSVDSNGQAQASASASAEASAGVRYANTSESSTEGSITQVTNTFKSGGDFTRTAKDTIVDQGTQVDAAGDLTQSARVIRDEAVSDASWSSSSSESHDARIGVYAGAEAEASTDGGADAGAGVGVKASYDGSIEKESESSTTAVVSRFKAGGNISSTSKEETVLVGAQFESGGDTTLDAGSLDYQAARDTSSSSSTSHEIGVELKASTGDASAEANYEMGTSSEQSSTARTGGISSGGNLTIRTRDNATFEGTNLNAGGAADIAAGGNVDFKAAQDTASSSETGVSVALGVSSSKTDSGGKEKSGEMGLGAEHNQASSSTAQVGSITAGGPIRVSAGNDVTLQGTQLSSGGTTELSAGNEVKLESAESTSSEFGIKADLSLKGSSTTGGTGAGNAGAAAADEDEKEPEGSSSLGLSTGSSSQKTKANIQSSGGTIISQKQGN
ncbi:filamentous hemagglutinin family N-terminal domain-containing protein [Halopseudomonas xinjiangensis]|uniref:Filamentous hemagglutinin family N-terminal domain-containing protein n=1 Tax=Halopseudomonas xinjiangensis TaxID=487184 RepID=A0A1H1N7Y8_9GAMM|nr:hemagglutinin repeat-containing protein [Halopseudomonas xinjiangensis]SDR95047.1 filamentous hemagglutinin family N-terminal domain-containing protein [Halopseudomonas xinjiangensis]